MVSWFGNLNVKNKAKLTRAVNLASKITGNKQRQLSDLYRFSIKRNVGKILYDDNHPLHQQFETLPSGRRLRMPLVKTNRYKFSFVPSAVRVMNETEHRK